MIQPFANNTQKKKKLKKKILSDARLVYFKMNFDVAERKKILYV